VLDTLALAREMHPGQRNSLDALCKRYDIDNSRRELHGALLDARILAEVYLAMTGGQSALELSESRAAVSGLGLPSAPWQRPTEALRVVTAEGGELAAHEALLDRIAKASGGTVLFRRV
jgi:DNA polymerase-3 subunit epsilon